MKPSLRLAIATALLAIPSFTLAAFERPSDVVRALQSSTTAMDMAQEFHVQVPSEEVYVSVWMKGTAKKTSAIESDADMKLTVDVVAPKTKVRAKLQLKATGDDVYLHVDSVEGTYSDELVELAAQLKGPKWLAFLSVYGDREAKAMMVRDMEEMNAAIGEFVDAAFVLEKKGANAYALRLKPDAARALGMEDTELGGLLQIVSNAAMEAQITTAGDEIRSLRFSLSLATDDLFFKAVIRGSGTMNARLSPFGVTAPADAVNLEEYMGSMPFYNPLPFYPTGTDAWDESEWDEEDWSSLEDPCMSDDPAARFNATRRGECGAPTESPRRLEDRLNQNN